MARGYVDPNFPNPNGPDDAPVIIYGYTPSLAVGLLGIILFAISLVLHIYQVIRYRTWYFVTIPIGLSFEIIGYIFRLLSTKKDPYRVTYFVIQYFFIVVAPVFFSAGIYTVLSHLINALDGRAGGRGRGTGKSYAPLKPKLILWIFITADVVATIIQILGAAMIGVAQTKRKDPDTANNILLAGLAIQALSFLIFIVLFMLFLWRSRHVLYKSVTSKAFIAAFIAAVVLVYLRVCFRLAETAQGLGSDLSSKEVYFGCLEFMPVVLAVYLLNIWHPGRCIARRGMTEDGNMGA
ncbi:RTA1 like protein [Delitschia confertaspora ATCC 74209]|uniref:RTA1 like protein n=1 Tax=Delitschia confertaspora ATCC 74209 TaxID=1513339 RepID=A0A9P4JYT1_9PLEO|nr:RTA1 like protein [Delitschia confertaspora ATCC 74209]